MKLNFGIIATTMLSSLQANAALISNTDITASTTLSSILGLTVDQIADGISAEPPAIPDFNGFASNASSGTIRLDLNIGPQNITSFEIFNDINVAAEGIKDFRLDFFDSGDSLISSFSDAAPVSQVAATTFTFGAVANVSRVDLVVLNSHPGFNRIEIREVTFNGTSAVPIPAAVWLFGSGLIGLIGVGRYKRA